MQYFYNLLSILLLLKECAATTLTLLPPSKPTSSLNSTHTSSLTSRPLSLSAQGHDCNPHDFGPQLAYSNCCRALSILPGWHAIGLFHREGTDDNYRLPYASVYKDYEIVVDFTNHLNEELGEWLENYLRAFEIIHTCVRTGAVGGNGLVRQHDRIRVSVGYRYLVASGNDSLNISNISGDVTDA